MPAIKIILTPTRRKERLHGIEYRIFEGVTDSGIKLEMLGLFRVLDVPRTGEFQKAVCAVDPGDPTPVTLLTSTGLIKP